MMSFIRCVSIAFVGAGVLMVGACNRDRATVDRERPVTGEQPANRDQPVLGEAERDKTPGTTTVTGAQMGVANQAAIEKIVSARCEREQRCNNVGPEKRFANPAACTQKIKADMHEDLSQKECPHGIDQKELDECLADIKKDSCDNPLDTLTRLAACRTGDLCLKTPSPNR